MQLITLISTCLCLGTKVLDAARILAVVPTPSISHQVVFRPLTQELVKRGHHVTVITTDPVFDKGKAPNNLTEIDLHDMSYQMWREKVYSSEFSSGNSNDIYQQISTFCSLMSTVFEWQIKQSEIKKILSKESHFDLLLIEGWFKPALMFIHVLKVPAILVSSFGGIDGQYDMMGAPSRPPLIYPTFLQQRLANLSLWEKLSELYSHYVLKNILHNQDLQDDMMIKRILGPDTPTIRELESNVDMLFLNVHPIWEMNRPVPPSILYMGGIHQKPAKELPKELKDYLDSSKHGVIYVSYGTNVSPSQLPPEKIQTMTKAFSKLPYDVLWKWDKDELFGRSENIRISKWLPQSDLLKHPKVKLFITQGGLQSTDEAITAGVPLIGMPMLGDQWYNVERYVVHKVGVRIDLDSLTEDKFLYAINTVIKDESYRKNMERLRSLMYDQPQSALSRAVWWTEHVLRHGGGRHLRAPAANMSWAQYLDVELLAVLAIAVLVALTGLALMLYLILKFVKSKEFNDYLDSSKHGVIYISYGTNANTAQLPPEKIQIITRAFSKLPYDVIWKWDSEELPGRPENIRISKWLPQSDLLKHPNVKLFITQGGLQSTDEAITAGVPLIGMPMFADQWYNVEHYVLHKVGVRVDMDSLTEDKFIYAINTVIKDESYRKNMERFCSLMLDQPQSALSRAVWWIEHVLRHGGGRHLRAPAADMSWAQYLDVELLAVLAIAVLVALTGLALMLYSILKFVKSKVGSCSAKLKKS